MRNRFFQTYVSTWSWPPDSPAKSYPEGVSFRQCSRSVVERLRLLEVKLAEISPNVKPLGEPLVIRQQACCFCGTDATNLAARDFVQNQRLRRSEPVFVLDNIRQHPDMGNFDFNAITGSQPKRWFPSRADASRRARRDDIARSQRRER